MAMQAGERPKRGDLGESCFVFSKLEMSLLLVVVWLMMLLACVV